MFRILILLAFTTVIFMQAIPAYCGASRTESFELSVTIPEHVFYSNAAQVNPFMMNTHQVVQTQTVVRNNQTITLTSIVVA